MKKANFQIKNGQVLFPIDGCSLFLPSAAIDWQVSSTEMVRERLQKKRLQLRKIFLLFCFLKVGRTVCDSVLVVGHRKRIESLVDY